MKVLIATKNKGKIDKYSTILKKLDIEYCTLEDINLNIEIEENGKTTTENAIIKAKAYYNVTHMPVLTDDSGLFIDKLPSNKQPGIFVRRCNNRNLSDEEILDLYSNEIEKVGGESTGYFIISIAIIHENGQVYTNETKHERLFVSKPDINRIEGYPLSSLVYDKKTKMYMTEKQKLSINVYEQSTFGKEYEFIKSVFSLI